MLYLIIIGISALIRRPRPVYYVYAGIGAALWLTGDGLTMMRVMKPLFEISAQGLTSTSNQSPAAFALAVSGLLAFRVLPFCLAAYGYRKSRHAAASAPLA